MGFESIPSKMYVMDNASKMHTPKADIDFKEKTYDIMSCLGWDSNPRHYELPRVGFEPTTL